VNTGTGFDEDPGREIDRDVVKHVIVDGDGLEVGVTFDGGLVVVTVNRGGHGTVIKNGVGGLCVGFLSNGPATGVNFAKTSCWEGTTT
jgi:hypothetical protein